MTGSGYSAAQLLAQGGPEKVQGGVDVVWRDRGVPETRTQYMTESRRVKESDVEVTEARGYLIVKPEKSIIVLSGHPGKSAHMLLKFS